MMNTECRKVLGDMQRMAKTLRDGRLRGGNEGKKPADGAVNTEEEVGRCAGIFTARRPLPVAARPFG